MASFDYEVLYVDKFTDATAAESTRINLQRKFHLELHQLAALSCGKPVVVKKGIGLEEAKRYRNAIAHAGGVAWIQALGPEGKHVERRATDRRALYDRRTVYRASSIQPDRRQSYGRRSNDRDIIH